MTRSNDEVVKVSALMARLSDIREKYGDVPVVVDVRIGECHDWRGGIGRWLVGMGTAPLKRNATCANLALDRFDAHWGKDGPKGRYVRIGVVVQ